MIYIRSYSIYTFIPTNYVCYENFGSMIRGGFTYRPHRHGPRGVSFRGRMFIMGGSPGELSEELVTWEKRKKCWRMSCDVGELCSFSKPFRHFTYATTHSQTLPSLYLRNSSFSNPSVASPTSQFILQPFFRFSYVTSSSLNSPGEPPMAFVE